MFWVCHFQNRGTLTHVQRSGHHTLCPGTVALPSVQNLPFQKAAVTLPGSSLVSAHHLGTPAAAQLAQEACV